MTIVNREDFENLKILYDYMHIIEPIEKSDIILGCGCRNKNIPVICSNLFKAENGNLIIFAGGFGKVTTYTNSIPESVVFKRIAMREGIDERFIITEEKSTNTGDNLRYSLRLLDILDIDFNSIILVHNEYSLRRTLNAGKLILSDKKISITSQNRTFEEYMTTLIGYGTDGVYREISLIVGEVERMIEYPKKGYQIHEELPDKVLTAFNALKDKFDMYSLTKKSNIYIKR